MKPYVIGVDIGTGSTKAVAIDYSGLVISSSKFYYSNLDAAQGFAEQDAEIIWQAFTDSIKKITSSLSYMPSAISLSSCMHSLMVIDNKHKPLTNLITWADTRSDEIAEEIRQSAEAENIYKVTGTPIHSMSPLCKIIWLKRNASEIFSKAFKFISIKEFIWHRLYNVYEIDYSIASATGLFDIKSFEWNNESLTLCGITSESLSRPVSTEYIRRDLSQSSAELLSISAGTPICIGASDGCLANVGSNAIEDGVAAITIGTSGAVRIANATPVYNYASMTFNYILDKENFICGGPVNNGGNILKWFFKSFLNNINPSPEDYNKIFLSAETISAGSNGLLFLPYIYGERAPVWDEKSCGVFFGIKDHHQQKHFFKAVLEGICYSLYTILQIVESSAGKVLQVNVSGGFIHSKIWMQVLADITGKKVCVIQADDASAIGAAIFYLKAAGIVKDYASLQHTDNITIQASLDNHEAYKKLYNVFKNLYSSLKEPMHQLQNINL